MFSTTAPPSPCDHAWICAAIAWPNASLRATTSAGNPATACAAQFLLGATYGALAGRTGIAEEVLDRGRHRGLDNDRFIVGLRRSRVPARIASPCNWPASDTSLSEPLAAASNAVTPR